MKNPFKGCRVPAAQLTDFAFGRAARLVKRKEFFGKKKEIARQKEGLRIKTVGSILSEKLDIEFPTEAIPEFYASVLDAVCGLEKARRCKSRIRKVSKKIKALQMKYLSKLKRARTTAQMRIIRKEFYGRCVACLKSVRSALECIRQACAVLSKLPDFKECPTIIIAGLPNVGKSSILSKLTGSAPEIKPYPFTTKGLMVGYTKHKFQDVQFIDTPGLLDRPLHKRNPIERQTIAALAHLGNIIIYVYDLSETCGYSVEQQKALLKEIKASFKIPIIVVANKTDLPSLYSPKDVGALGLSCKSGKGIKKLKEEIIKFIGR